MSSVDAASEEDEGESVEEMAEGLVAAVSVEPAYDRGDDVFTADEPDWFGPRVFGGMVVAQALNAAARTVDRERPVNSLHGYFLRPVVAGAPVELRVERVRDGRAFAVRAVVMNQHGAPVFRAMCSFHADEPGDEYQVAMTADLPSPETLPANVEHHDGPIDMREIGATPRGADGTFASTRRAWFRLPVRLPDDPALHATLIAFLSDMTGTGFRPHNLGEWGTHTDASLDHAIWFHRPARIDEWCYYDIHALVNAGARSTVRGELFSRDGVLRASMAQELLIRRLDGDSTFERGITSS